MNAESDASALDPDLFTNSYSPTVTTADNLNDESDNDESDNFDDSKDDSDNASLDFSQANAPTQAIDVKDAEEYTNKQLKRAISVSDNSRKKRRTSVYETAAITAADGMAALGTSIKDSQLLPPETRFDQAVRILNGLKKDGSITSEEHFKISKVFMEKERYVAFFVGVSEDLRMEWLVTRELIAERY